MKNLKVALLVLLPLALLIGVFVVFKHKRAPREQTLANLEEIFNRKESFDSTKFANSPEYYKELSRILREGKIFYSRARAANMLVYISSPTPAKPLFDALNFDKSALVRTEALKSLQVIRGLNRRARTVVNIEAVNSHNPELIGRSLTYLYDQTRGSPSNRLLYEVIAEAFPDAKDMKVLKTTATVMDLTSFVNQNKDIKTRLAAMDLLSYAKAPPMIRITIPLTQNRSENIRKQAARTLGIMRHYDSLPPLIKMLNEDKSQEVRITAAESLARLHAYPALQTAAQSKTDVMARLAGVTALGLLRNPMFFDLLKNALSDQNSEVRRAAAYGLGRYRTSAALEPLQQALKKEKTAQVKTELQMAIRLSGGK